MTQSSDNPRVRPGEEPGVKHTNTNRTANCLIRSAAPVAHRPTSGGLAAQANGDGE